MKSTLTAVAATLLCLSVSSVEASPARVLNMAAMRASPGTSYAIVAVVPRGKIVNARYCISNGWCRVKWRGRLGWINGKLLRTRLIHRRG
ncbi:SH3 domain-containing protein [Bradyrhizobium sp. 83012]|uniref:SH3 domain-containing protein n=1 Tax=Bradyrhizobium aeschynomenes TaxID=2734909 RepID=A0ABX2C5S9_9BRAD|nr:SH3 domain-containing protein [Bradyrhizobium aeschynomenes]NPU13142.1 SH3 domain-containing protein [Bradyrhizobium aeschynomenes]NPU63644.1 SH3 domain-containing protein [Bradyrhizobium aeschynomenes]NPV19355.1 SH3 domain-containing protein [Bradyrhizobium aeschynomenes]